MARKQRISSDNILRYQYLRLAVAGAGEVAIFQPQDPRRPPTGRPRDNSANPTFHQIDFPWFNPLLNLDFHPLTNTCDALVSCLLSVSLHLLEQDSVKPSANSITDFLPPNILPKKLLQVSKMPA